MKGILAFLSFAFALTNFVASVEVGLDRAVDVTKLLDISCAYSDDYADFWGYGCPTNPSNDIYPTVEGFWTACQKNCEIIYHGGLLPNPTKVYISTYIKGETFIEVSGKDNPADPDFNYNYGYISEHDEEASWCYQEFDLSEVSGLSASVLNVTLTSSQNGFVLVDKVIVDLGDQQINPIPLDTINDEIEKHWAYDDCLYLEDYHDFWAYGCPADTTGENPTTGAVGYWSPCMEQSCKIEYLTSPSIIPSSITVRGYLSESAEISVIIPELKKELFVLKGKELGGWVDFEQDLTSAQAYKIDVVLKQNGGTVILDALYFNFTQSFDKAQELPDFPKCINTVTTTEDPTTTESSPDTTNPTTDETPYPTTDETPNPTTDETPNPTTDETPNPTTGETPHPTTGETPNPTTGETLNPTTGETNPTTTPNPTDPTTTPNPTDPTTTPNPTDPTTTPNPTDPTTTPNPTTTPMITTTQRTTSSVPITTSSPSASTSPETTTESAGSKNIPIGVIMTTACMLSSFLWRFANP